MKKFLINIIPYLMLTVIITYCRYEFGAGGSFTDTRSMVSVKVKKITNAIVIIGDSKSKAGFLDTLLNQHSTKTIYNISIWAARPLDNIALINDINIENSTVFLCVTSRTFLSPDTISGLKDQFNINRLYDFNLYPRVAAYYARRSDGRWEYTNEVNGSLLFKNKTRPWGRYSVDGDSTYNNDILNDSLCSYYTATKIRYLADLYKTLLSKNNKVLLIDLPERMQYRKWVQVYEYNLFSAITERTGGQIHSFGIYDSTYFYDSHHLNYIGVNKFTAAFIDTFSAVFNE